MEEKTVKRKKPTQQSKILEMLRNGERVTNMDAFEKVGCTRLSGQIFCLRKKGYNIVSIDTVCTNRFGDNVRYCEYKLVEEGV